MNKIFHLPSVFKAVNNDGSVYIEGWASTDSLDRAGDVIRADAWTKKGLANFKKNPIILFNHDYDQPIGKAVEITPSGKGLFIKVLVSKVAANILELIKEGILGAFSVGFRVIDAEYDTATEIFVIKEVELFEVSVVSIPCNQDATFSLSKSFDSDSEFSEFKKSIINREAEEHAADEEVNASLQAPKPSVSLTTKVVKSQEKKLMTPEEIQAMVTKAASDAAEATRKKMEADAAEEKAKLANKAAEEVRIKELVATITKTGADELLADVKKQLEAKDAKIDEVLKANEASLKEHATELEAIRNSKRNFADRGSDKKALSDWGKEFLQAKLFGVITKKGFETAYGKQVLEKAGVNYTTSAADIDQTVNTQIEKEIRLELRAAGLFREIPVIAGATVLPIQPDSGKAVFQAGGAPDGNLTDRAAGTANTFVAQQVILNCYRLISSTYLDNDVDEQVLVNFLPMLIDAVARAHARAVDEAVVIGSGSITGLGGYATVNAVDTLDISDGEKLTAAMLHGCRRGMGKYGLRTSDLAYIVSQSGYYDLTEDDEFKDITQVGSDMALKVTGTVGSVYGVPVVVSDSFVAPANNSVGAIAVNHRNYVIPRLRSVNLEQDYEVNNQRKLIVASQSLGFEELVDGTTNNQPSVYIKYVS